MPKLYTNGGNIFQARRKEAQMLYDEEFCRMWEFYLVAAEIGFRQNGQIVFQIQVTKQQDALPLTHEYIAKWEKGVVGEENQAAQ